jgi:type II secretory pathway pseudopilin PulG
MTHRFNHGRNYSGFTVIELIVAVSVTALLSGLLLLISSQVLNTQTKSSSELETNEIAQFVLDKIQEDLQCAVYRNDGNVWMAMRIIEDKDLSGSWDAVGVSGNGKDQVDSIRIVESDWSNNGATLNNSQIDALGQGPFEMSRFGVGGTWLRFFSQSPEPDVDSKNNGAVRAISYQIIRHGITSALKSKKRYQLFRSDVSAKNTFEAGYNLHPDQGVEETAYNRGKSLANLTSPRLPDRLIDPIIPEGSQYPATSFSLAANIIDFGVRAYVLERNSSGTGNLVQIFPAIHIDAPGTIKNEGKDFLATSLPKYRTLVKDSESRKKFHQFYAFPDVVDLMIRVLSSEGARLLEAFEEIPDLSSTDTLSWWSIAEEHSKVYFRRVKIYGQGL